MEDKALGEMPNFYLNNEGIFIWCLLKPIQIFLPTFKHIHIYITHKKSSQNAQVLHSYVKA